MPRPCSVTSVLALAAFVLALACNWELVVSEQTIPCDQPGGSHYSRSLQDTEPEELNVKLPPGACYWRQGLLNSPIVNCTFQVRDNAFLAILGPSPELKLETVTPAHEGGVYYPDTNEFFFSSTRLPGQPVKLQKLNLETKVVSTLVDETLFANGLVLDNEGQLLVCEQGKEGSPGHITRIHPVTGHSTIVADNWFNIPFNSPNDAVVKSDGSIWFTDPDYARAQGYGNTLRVKNQVYRIDPVTHLVDVVADNFVKPNGLAFSPDEKRLYIADSGYYLGTTGLGVDIQKPHTVTVFDVVNGRTLRNRNFFTSVARYDGTDLAIPDGIKVDTNGNVYVSTIDGIQVFDEDAKPLGLIHVPGPPNPNMGFAGPKLDTLYILNDVSIHSVKLSVRAAGLAYATKYHNLQPPQA